MSASARDSPCSGTAASEDMEGLNSVLEMLKDPIGVGQRAPEACRVFEATAVSGSAQSASPCSGLGGAPKESEFLPQVLAHQTRSGDLQVAAGDRQGSLCLDI